MSEVDWKTIGKHIAERTVYYDLTAARAFLAQAALIREMAAQLDAVTHVFGSDEKIEALLARAKEMAP